LMQQDQMLQEIGVGLMIRLIYPLCTITYV
jgi:hypothetical protein